MNYYSLFPFLGSIASMLLGVYIIHINSKMTENRLFFLLTITIGFWSFIHFIMFSTQSLSIAKFWAQFDTWCSTLSAVLIFHFFMIYTKIHIKGFKKYILLVLYVTALIFGFLDYTTDLIEQPPTLHFWGYFSDPGILYIFPTIFILGCIICGLIINVKYYFISTFKHERKQALLLVAAISIPVIVGVFTEIIPTIFNYKVIPLTTTLAAFMVIIITYTMRKYKLMTPMEYQLRKVNQLFNTLPNAIALLNKEGKICELNDSMSNYLNESRNKLLGNNIYTLLPEKVSRVRQKIASEALETGKIKKNEDKVKSRYFSNLFIPTKFIGGDSNILMISNDITEQKHAEQQIKQDLEEKNILLKEIHHRVKNNLQIMRSLIHLQQLKNKNPDFQTCAENLSDRINSMALIHEQLYNSDNMAKIDLKKYIESFFKKLLQSYNLPNIIIEQKIDDIYLSLEKSVPVGLIINELLTNALKHGFRDQEKGKIKFLLKREKEICKLRVMDNGKGISEEINLKEPDTLGLKLVKILTEQLHGEMKIYMKNGTFVDITFPC